MAARRAGTDHRPVDSVRASTVTPGRSISYAVLCMDPDAKEMLGSSMNLRMRCLAAIAQGV